MTRSLTGSTFPRFQERFPAPGVSTPFGARRSPGACGAPPVRPARASRARARARRGPARARAADGRVTPAGGTHPPRCRPSVSEGVTRLRPRGGSRRGPTRGRSVFARGDDDARPRVRVGAAPRVRVRAAPRARGSSARSGRGPAGRGASLGNVRDPGRRASWVVSATGTRRRRPRDVSGGQGRALARRHPVARPRRRAHRRRARVAGPGRRPEPRLFHAHARKRKSGDESDEDGTFVRTPERPNAARQRRRTLPWRRCRGGAGCHARGGARDDRPRDERPGALPRRPPTFERRIRDARDAAGRTAAAVFGRRERKRRATRSRRRAFARRRDRVRKPRHLSSHRCRGFRRRRRKVV